MAGRILQVVRTIGLIVLGVQLWLVAGRGLYGRDSHLLVLLACAAASVVVAWLGPRSFPRWAVLSPTARLLREPVAGVAVGFASVLYLVSTALHSGRTLAPSWGDDQAYMLQLRMLATGRLWTVAHPLADFFENCFILVKPVYASMYFPGAAMLYVPTIWLGLPPWVLPVLTAGAVVGLTYAVVAQAVGRREALLAAVMMVGIGAFRVESTIVASRLPLMLLGLVATWAFLRWWRDGRWRWFVVMGAAMGWAAVTRPLDAVCFAVPLVVGVASRLRANWAAWARAALIATVAAGPFLAVQGVFNHGVTGNWLYTPFRVYADQDLPNTHLGFHGYDPAVRPRTELAFKQSVYDEHVVKLLKNHRPDNLAHVWLEERLPATTASTLPHPLLAAFFPAGVAALWIGWPRRDRDRDGAPPDRVGALVIAGVLPMFVLAYAFYAFFLGSYPLMAAPAVVMMTAMAPRAIADAFPRAARFVYVFAGLSIVTLSLLQLPELNRFVYDQRAAMNFESVEAELAKLPRPAIVLIDAGPLPNDLFVFTYNTGVVNPDDAPLIRANDLGPRNRELFAYYATTQPARRVYRYAFKSRGPVYLGTVTELATGKRPATTTAPAPAPAGQPGGR
jgi:hypothetical protein